MSDRNRILIWIVALILAARPASAISLSSQSDFDDGTTQGWTGASPSNPSDFLQLQSTGGLGPGSRPAARNFGAQWTGDYATAGVTTISLRLRNAGGDALSIRAVLFGPIDRWTSTDAFSLPGDGQWHSVIFDLTELSLTQVTGSGSYADTIGGVTQLMFRHDADSPSAGGSPALATVDIDNVRAVPEPHSALFVTLGLLILGRRVRGSRGPAQSCW